MTPEQEKNLEELSQIVSTIQITTVRSMNLLGGVDIPEIKNFLYQMEMASKSALDAIIVYSKIKND